MHGADGDLEEKHHADHRAAEKAQSPTPRTRERAAVGEPRRKAAESNGVHAGEITFVLPQIILRPHGARKRTAHDERGDEQSPQPTLAQPAAGRMDRGDAVEASRHE